MLAISRRWKQPEEDYRAWYAARAGNDFGLGAVRFVQVEPDTWVANMVAQHGMTASKSGPPIRYDAVKVCLGKVGTKARELGVSERLRAGWRQLVRDRAADRGGAGRSAGQRPISSRNASS